MHRQSNTTTHRDTVQERYIWLRVGRNHVIELVFQREVVFRFLLALSAILILLSQCCYIAASAECSPSALDDDRIRQLAILPLLQARDDLPSHRAIETVQLLGPVELDGADAVDGVEEDIIRFVAGLLTDFYLACELAMVSQSSGCQAGRLLLTVREPIAGLVILARRGIVVGRVAHRLQQVWRSIEATR